MFDIKKDIQAMTTFEVMMFDFDFIGVPPITEVFISGVLLHRHDDRRRHDRRRR